MQRKWMEAPIGLHTKLKKTGTFEMTVMQKPHIGELAHIISTYGLLVTTPHLAIL